MPSALFTFDFKPTGTTSLGASASTTSTGGTNSTDTDSYTIPAGKYAHVTLAIHSHAGDVNTASGGAIENETDTQSVSMWLNEGDQIDLYTFADTLVGGGFVFGYSESKITIGNFILRSVVRCALGTSGNINAQADASVFVTLYGT